MERANEIRMGRKRGRGWDERGKNGKESTTGANVNNGNHACW